MCVCVCVCWGGGTFYCCIILYEFSEGRANQITMRVACSRRMQPFAHDSSANSSSLQNWERGKVLD